MNGFLLVAWLSSCGADAATTHYAIAQRGARELVLTSNPWANDAMIAGSAAVVASSYRHLRPSHPKLATVLLIASVSFRAAIVAHNVRQLAR